MIFKLVGTISMIMLCACASTNQRAIKSKCSIVKHPRDNVFQIQIDKQPINDHWYIHPEALRLARVLAKQKRCQP